MGEAVVDRSHPYLVANVQRERERERELEVINYT